MFAPLTASTIAKSLIEINSQSCHLRAFQSAMTFLRIVIPLYLFV
jgi:hypothetical protein